jgi:hypothetical protein
MTYFRTSIALVALVLAACGGGATPTQPPAGSSTPGASSPSGGATSSPMPTAAAGESITADDVAAALRALQALDSWKFAGKYWQGHAGAGTEQSVAGVQRQKPEVAVDAVHHSADSDNRYIRIGDDIWVTLGDTKFYHYDAADSANLISQYEPAYVADLVADAAGSQLEYDPVGVETVNGAQAMHYTLSGYNREKLTELSGLDPDKWAGDVWIATNGGYLVKFAWGPQNTTDAQPVMGFNYDTLEVNCDCPVEAPTDVATP